MILKASISKAGSCKEPDFPCDRLGSKDETAGWQVHPELGVPGLTVKLGAEETADAGPVGDGAKAVHHSHCLLPGSASTVLRPSGRGGRHGQEALR
eukprot:symbB.v1.2.000801.t1/scaffold44.1/size390916/14